MTAPFLSVIIPAFQEEAGLAFALERIRLHADPLGRVEYILIDDGSTDRTWEVIQALSRRHLDVRGLRLSRNFGKEAAITAGLNEAGGTIVVTMDSDLQHPPDLLPRMVACWKAGAKVVNAVKRTRESEGPLKAWLTRRYFGLFERLAGIDVGNSSDYKLLDREVVECLKALPERERFYRGLVGWVGFEQETLLFDVAPRVAGYGKWSPVKLFRLAMDSIVSFSTLPMHLMTCLGVGFAVFAAALGARTFWLWIAGAAVPGFTTVILLLIIVGAFLMIGLGIIGAYIAKIYEEVKRRPAFIVQQQTPSADLHQDRDRDQTVRSLLGAQTGAVSIREVAR